MSFTSSLFQTAAGATVVVLPVARGVLAWSALAGLLILFRPLLTGIARALMMVINPRLTKEQKAARRSMRNAQQLPRWIRSSSGPNDAAELRAMAARG